MSISRADFARMATAAVASPPRIFDWAKDCPDIVMRVFPPIVGEGRGEVAEPYTCVRCGRESWRPFTRGHRPLDSDRRTCGGTVVKRSQVERTRAEEQRKFVAGMMGLADAESGFRPLG